MADDANLVEWLEFAVSVLRVACTTCVGDVCLHAVAVSEAADRIEALVAERDAALGPPCVDHPEVRARVCAACYQEATSDERAAYRKGQENMRERAIRHAKHVWPYTDTAYLLHALPIDEK